MARPLRTHELDAHAFGSTCFDPRGLIVAERDDRIVGFAHAGFGPKGEPSASPPFQLGRELGTIAMLVIHPEEQDPEVEHGLVFRAEAYLRERGARVLYMGGQYPLNPFYWGLYGGSEFAGILARHDRWHRIAGQLGYKAVSSTTILEADLEQPGPRDPRAAILRRQTRIDFHEEELPKNWWISLALGDFHPAQICLRTKLDDQLIGWAGTWDMSWFSRTDGRARMGVIDFEIALAYRRQGYGRFLLSEILRSAREQMFSIAQLQTNSENQAALALYASAGFHPVDETTLYRLPAHLMDRSA